MRNIEENRAMADLARVMVRVNEQEKVKDDSARLARAEMAYFEKQHRDDFSIDFFKMYDLYIDRLNEETRIADERLEEMRPEMEEVRGKALEASRQRRIVELLRERHLERHKEEARRAERKALTDQQIMAQSGGPFSATTSGALDLTEFTHEAIQHQPRPTAKRAESEDDEQAGLEDTQHQREEDALADYYRQLGIPDPRE